uniref:Retrotransposon Copia-like N-terminal domain-containing protein n=1 Tax=Ananas comosus var. bracteatus TaxID=296719 RepID=A0A6V7NSJ2_ANACO|nr:unnamed protein product [Ananas comosus var. bracteatus]
MSENKSENETPETSIDDSDPLVLHYSDHPGMMLVSKPLEGYNYGQWSRAMRISLSAKNKIGFVDGSIKGHQSVSVYYTKLKGLWDELASYHEPPCCTCGGLKALVEREEKERVMQFLMGLNESYATIRGSILMMRPFPDTRKVHALVLQQERQVDVAAKRKISVGHHAMQYSSLPQANRPPVLSESGTPKRLLKCRSQITRENVKPKGKRPVAHNTQNNDVEPLKVPTTATATFTTEEYNQLMVSFAKETVMSSPLPTSQHSCTSTPQQNG